MTSKKAAKDLWYQDLLDAFFFGIRGTKFAGEFILSLEILSVTQPDTKCHSGAKR